MFAIRVVLIGLSIMAGALCENKAWAQPGTVLLRIENPSPQAGDEFGAAVDASKKVIVIGAPSNTETSYIDGGAAYIYDNKLGTILASIDNPDADTGTSFGASVSAGKSVIIGEPVANEEATSGGRAYQVDLKTLQIVRTITNPDPEDGDLFGFDVELGKKFVGVGAPGDDDGITPDTGAAYTADTKEFALSGTFVPTSNTASQAFGSALGIVKNSIAIGAPGPVSETTYGSGVVYIFDTKTNLLVDTIESPSPTENDRFGAAIDGAKTLLVGAPGYDDNVSSNTGRAYLFDLKKGTSLTFDNPSSAPDDEFGYSVAFSKKYAIIGVPGDDTNGPNTGAVYVFDVKLGTLVQTVTNPDGATNLNARFGASVASDGKRLIIGAPGSTDGVLPGAGRVYIIEMVK